MSEDDAKNIVLGNLDQAPRPATPEELEDFKNAVLNKVNTSFQALKKHDELYDIEISSAMWEPRKDLQIQIGIGALHEPDAVDVVTVEFLGEIQGVDTQLRKHYRYFPSSGISEYEEEVAEYYNGRRLIPEEVQRMKERMPEITPEKLNAEVQRMIEHAKDLSQKYAGAGYPPLDHNSIVDVMDVLLACNDTNAVKVLV